MLDDEDELPIRYHLDEQFELERGERVFLDGVEAGTANWSRLGELPDDAKTPEALRAFVRDAALTQRGERRAMTERGELLYVYGVAELSKELSGRDCISMQPFEQLCLSVARARLAA